MSPKTTIAKIIFGLFIILNYFDMLQFLSIAFSEIISSRIKFSEIITSLLFVYKWKISLNRLWEDCHDLLHQSSPHDVYWMRQNIPRNEYPKRIPEYFDGWSEQIRWNRCKNRARLERMNCWYYSLYLSLYIYIYISLYPYISIRPRQRRAHSTFWLLFTDYRA